MANQPGEQQESSVSPDPQQSYPEHHQPQQLNIPHHDRFSNGREPEHVLEPPTSSYGPPPVDFTSYSTSSHVAYRDSSTPTYPSVSNVGEMRTNRKRTLSIADRNLPSPIDDRPNSNAQSNAVRNRSPAEVIIDPSLSAYARSGNTVQNQAASVESREDRRLRMRREREEMQARLRRLDDELQAMDEEEG